MIAIAENEAMKSTMFTKLGAVLFSGSIESGKVFSVGHNQLGTITRKSYALKSINSIHAEMNCLLSCKSICLARKSPKDSKRRLNILVVKCCKERFGASLPCVLCQALIRRFRIKKIYYSTETGAIAMMKVNKPLSTCFITNGTRVAMNSEVKCQHDITRLIKKLSSSQ
jgi:deoxycytidylate deaminase